LTQGKRANVAARFWRALGPGLITGAADDDPSGIATYSQAGAQFGYGLTWTVLLTLPFMVAIQIVSAAIGWCTGNGLAHNIAGALPRSVLYGLVTLLVVANTVNIAADLAAMGEAVQLVLGGPALIYVAVLGVISLTAEIFIPYHRYAGYLKYLTAVLLFYVATALVVHVPWLTVFKATLLPQVSLDRDLVLTVVAVFGTTISPYLFFWQASQEAEDSRLSYRRKYETRPASGYLRRIVFDTWSGMAVSNIIAFFIIVTAAATLNAQGITHVTTAAQAAEALRPIAGDLAFGLFAAGIVGTGLLAVPVLAGSAAYAVAETFGLQGSLELPVGRALGFYGIVGAATLGGVVLAASDFEPMAMLFWSAVINGVVAIPIMIAMMVVVSTKRGAKTFALPVWIKLLGWMAAVLMTAAVAVLAWSEFS
jgi:NRAMP (natural resistance-associated macrophage protein)-like metal ion transporter